MKPKSNQNHIAEVSKKVGHTLTPWHYAPGELIYGPNGESVASCRFVTNFKDENIENMRFIVRAVNSHEALLEATKVAFEIMGHETNTSNNRPYLMLKDAIAQAEGEIK